MMAVIFGPGWFPTGNISLIFNVSFLMLLTLPMLSSDPDGRFLIYRVSSSERRQIVQKICPQANVHYALSSATHSPTDEAPKAVTWHLSKEYRSHITFHFPRLFVLRIRHCWSSTSGSTLWWEHTHECDGSRNINNFSPAQRFYIVGSVGTKFGTVRTFGFHLFLGDGLSRPKDSIRWVLGVGARGLNSISFAPIQSKSFKCMNSSSHRYLSLLSIVLHQRVLWLH